MEDYINQIDFEKKKLYRKNYYEKNKEKIQNYQREYYRKYIKKKEKKRREPSWRGEKIQTIKFTFQPITLSFK